MFDQAPAAISSNRWNTYLVFVTAFILISLMMPLLSAQAALAESPAKERAPYRFAPAYTMQDLLNNPGRADAFIRQYLRWEGEFFSIIRRSDNGFCYDGYDLDTRTGQAEKPRIFSAPSKECLDVALTVNALTGDPYAAIVVSPKDPSRAQAEALRILEKKISGYEDYLKKNPGYAGYLPWYICQQEIKPAQNWVNQFPGLDNGEWIWSLLVAERVLDLQGHHDLAKRYHAYNDRIKNNIVSIFYDPKEGRVRGDMKFSPSGSGGFSYSPVSSKCPYLTGEHGIHEGMMLILYVCLFGKDLPADGARRIWSDILMKRIETRYGTTWEGWYASSHEEWAFLFIPLRDMPEYRDLFRIREKIRSCNAREKGYPGFATSCLVDRENYIDKAGIEGVVSHPLINNHTFALYGAFPLVLECAGREGKNYGLAWLHTMLMADRMQGPMGAGESGSNDGTKASDVKTIDGSFTINLALCGGLERETAELLKHEKVYDRFREIMTGEYRETFGSEPLREPMDFALPGVSVPKGILGDYEWEPRSGTP